MLSLAKDFDKSEFSGLELIGKGAFAHVFKTYNNHLKATIVLKILPKAKIDEKTVLTEVSALNHLRGRCADGILCYIDFRQDPRNYYVITEYLGDFVTLEKYGESQIVPEALAKIIENMKNGLIVCHEAGIAHRDIKPANIMINPKTLDTKYLDFGLSCRLDTCYMRVSLGTPAYAGPESMGIIGTIPDTLGKWYRFDLWSLGMVIMYLLLREDFIDFYGMEHMGKIPIDLIELTNVYEHMYENGGMSDKLLKEICDKYYHGTHEYLSTSVLPMVHMLNERRNMYVDKNASISNPDFEKVEITLTNY